jgi:hypothetical protein
VSRLTPAYSAASATFNQIFIARLEKAFRKFGAARFKALYRWWLVRGDSAIWAAQSPVLRDAIAYGEGRLECVELSRQYLQLTSLVGVA